MIAEMCVSPRGRLIVKIIKEFPSSTLLSANFITEEKLPELIATIETMGRRFVAAKWPDPEFDYWAIIHTLPFPNADRFTPDQAAFIIGTKFPEDLDDVKLCEQWCCVL